MSCSNLLFYNMWLGYNLLRVINKSNIYFNNTIKYLFNQKIAIECLIHRQKKQFRLEERNLVIALALTLIRVTKVSLWSEQMPLNFFPSDRISDWQWLQQIWKMINKCFAQTFTSNKLSLGSRSERRNESAKNFKM